MRRFVWFRSLGRLGEEVIDLCLCRRFVVSEMFDEESETVIFFLAPGNRWIKYTKGYQRHPEDGTPYISKQFQECFPEQVAHTLLWEKVFGDRLPEELNAYRQYGDIRVYNQWLYANSDKIYGDSASEKFVLPQYDGVSVIYGDKLCKSFARKAPNQQKVLDEFQKCNWPRTIKDPLNDQHRLKQTIKDMNEWEYSAILFRQDGRGVCWKPRLPEPMSRKTS